MATKASRSSIMPYYGLFCPELAFSRRSAHKGKRMERRNHLHREFVPRSGQDYGDKSMVSPASPAGLVLRSRHLVRKSNADEMRVSRYLSGETSHNGTSGSFRQIHIDE